MRLIIYNGREVLDLPYDNTALELCEGSNGRAFLTCSKVRSTSSIFDFNSLEDGRQEFFNMAKASLCNQSYYYLRKGREDDL